jgi:hypothetical protein
MSGKSRTKRIALCVAILAINIGIFSQPISKYLVGNNAWQNPGDGVWNTVASVGYQVIRFGGEGYDGNTGGYQGWAGKTFGMGAMPIVQIPQGSNGGSAAGYVNDFPKVALFNIGNEPDLPNFGGSGDKYPEVSGYVKASGPAMHKKRKEMIAKDPSLPEAWVFAPDIAEFLGDRGDKMFNNMVRNGGQYDICGKDAEGYYYIDGVSWHKYPYFNGQERNGEMTGWYFDDVRENIIACKRMVDSASARVGRTGKDAIKWGNGEYNSNPADGGSFENGLFHAMALGVAMKYEATYMCSWSMQEGYNFSVVQGGGIVPYGKAESMVAKNFSGWFYDAMDSTVGCATTGNILAYACKDTNKLVAMIINRSFKDHESKEMSFTLRFDTKAITTGDVKLNFDANCDGEYSDKVPAHSIVMVRFDTKTGTKQVFSKGMGDPAKSTIATSPFTTISPIGSVSGTKAPIGMTTTKINTVFSKITQVGRTLNIAFPAASNYKIQFVSLNGKTVATYSGTGADAQIINRAMPIGQYCMHVTTSEGTSIKRVLMM